MQDIVDSQGETQSGISKAIYLRDNEAMTGIHFVTDEKGRKIAVQIDLKKHGAALEGFWDGLISGGQGGGSNNRKSRPGTFEAHRIARRERRLATPRLLLTSRVAEISRCTSLEWWRVNTHAGSNPVPPLNSVSEFFNMHPCEQRMNEAQET